MPRPDEPRWSDEDIERLKAEWEREREWQEVKAQAQLAASAIMARPTHEEVDAAIDAKLSEYGVISRHWFSTLWGRATLILPGLLVLLAVWNTVVAPIWHAITRR